MAIRDDQLYFSEKKENKIENAKKGSSAMKEQ